jgi:hypothetical protein
MQGYVQIELCEIEDLSFYLILISRRSRERAGMPRFFSFVIHLKYQLIVVVTGLRYQRRGINEQGHVANFVETEQILLTTVNNGSLKKV